MVDSAYEKQCLDYLATTETKTDFIKYAKHLLENGEDIKAIEVLEKGKKDDWPDIYR